jgi:hypothetical protein
METNVQAGRSVRPRAGRREVQAELAEWVQVSPKEWVRRPRAWDSSKPP